MTPLARKIAYVKALEFSVRKTGESRILKNRLGKDALGRFGFFQELPFHSPTWTLQAGGSISWVGHFVLVAWPLLDGRACPA